MRESHHILALSRDLGSVQAILPVVQALSAEASIQVSLVTTEVARPLCERYGMKAEYLMDQHFHENPSRVIASLLQRYQPSLIISGSSPAKGPSPETPEQYAIIEGRRLGIPTVAVLDFWGMYHERFVVQNGGVTEALLPDVLCVLDTRCQKDLLALGVPPSRMRVTHNPWLDQTVQEACDPPGPSSLLEGKGGLRVVFVSQPLAEMSGSRSWLYDQEQAFNFFLHALPVSLERPHLVLICPHPGEHPERWEKARIQERSDVEVVVIGERGAAILAHADMVTSSHSTLLYEALYYGTPVVSLRPGNSVHPPPLYADELGLSLLFGQRQALTEYLAKMDPAVERNRLLKAKQDLLARQVFYSDGQATRRVAEIVLRQLMSPSLSRSPFV